jgi:hypothetical protein
MTFDVYHTGKHEHAYTLAGLQIGLERIADALSTS